MKPAKPGKALPCTPNDPRGVAFQHVSYGDMKRQAAPLFPCHGRMEQREHFEIETSREAFDRVEPG